MAPVLGRLERDGHIGLRHVCWHVAASAGASGWALVFRLLEAHLENAGRVVREVTIDDALPHEIGCPGISV